MRLSTVLLIAVLTSAVDGFFLPRHEQKRTPLIAKRPSESGRGPRTVPFAVVIPGDSMAEVVLVDGSLNFLGLYMGLLTVRILLSWFPQAQSVSLLQPIFTVSDAYLNLFRGIVPPIGGIDISPIGAFFVLNLLTNSVASLGSTGPLPDRPTRGQQLNELRRKFVDAQSTFAARFKAC